VGETIAGRYRVERCIGLGGMAVVFLGSHVALDRSVAIKVLRPELESHRQIVDRFAREARIASHLEHPNCIQVFDVGATRHGFSFMVMPFLEGIELSKALSIPFAPSQAVSLATQIATGLEYVHRCGVVHRDLKPDNVFAARDHDGRTGLRIVDFGVAKLLEGAQSRDSVTTKVGTIVGSPSHMSPEQALGLEADPRADLYSLGLILYQMLTARLPFDADDPNVLLRKQVRDAVPALTPHIDARVAAVTMRLLAKAPEERYADAAALLGDLRRLSQLLSSDPQPWRPVLPSPAAPRDEQPGPALGGQTFVAVDDFSESINRPPSERSGRRALTTDEHRIIKEAISLPNENEPAAELDEMGAALEQILGAGESDTEMLTDLLGEIEGIDGGDKAR